MSYTVRFSQKDFRRGVDDVITLAPLREAVRELTGRYATKPSQAKDAAREGRSANPDEPKRRDTPAKR